MNHRLIIPDMFVNKKVHALSVILLLAFAGCSRKDVIDIKGTLEGGSGKKVILEAIGLNAKVPVDSASCSTAGNFHLKGAMTEAGFFSIRVSENKEFITLALHPGEKVNLNLPGKEYWKNYTVEGSEDSKRIQELTLANYTVLDEINALGKIFHDSINSINLPAIKNSLDSSYHLIVEHQRSQMRDFVRQNARYLASLMALFQRMPSGNPSESDPLFTPENDFSLFKMVDSTLNLLYPTAEPVKAIHAEMLGMEEDYRQAEKNNRISGIGAIPPDIRLPSFNNDSISLYASRGKYTLLVFWSSFDQASRLENKNLYTLYNNYHWKGLNIFQVGIERNKEAWAAAVSSDKISWPQVYDIRLWNSPLVPVFKIEKLPLIYLLDKEGRIIDKGLAGENLSARIRELFKQIKPAVKKSQQPDTTIGMVADTASKYK